MKRLFVFICLLFVGVLAFGNAPPVIELDTDLQKVVLEEVVETPVPVFESLPSAEEVENGFYWQEEKATLINAISEDKHEPQSMGFIYHQHFRKSKTSSNTENKQICKSSAKWHKYCSVVFIRS